MSKIERLSALLITQGKHKFYSLTMTSDLLATTCYVTSRFDDPIEGFQRTLDENKARQIAEYIDKGNGTIPTAIILSAQPECDFEYNSKNKTVEFNTIAKAFLIIDGQHRVFGFSLTETSVRVPVIIYSGLSRKDESRLFIDINTKQRPVPNELLLDIKAQADYETDSETNLRGIFDKFKDEPSSALYGKLSASEKSTDKISRVTFNAAIKPITYIIGELEIDEVFEILNAYLKAIEAGFRKKGIEKKLTSPYVFRAVLAIFPDVAGKVKDKFTVYSLESFYNILVYFFDRITINKVNKRMSSSKELTEHFLDCLKKGFTL